MSGANETRGEIALELEGVEYVLRPSYDAIQAIEKKLGRGMLALARTSGEGDLTLGEMAIIAAECIKAHGRAKDDKHLAAVSPERLAEMILEAEDGLAGVMGRLTVMLGLAVTGGYDRSGELKPVKVSQSATA